MPPTKANELQRLHLRLVYTERAETPESNERVPAYEKRAAVETTLYTCVANHCDRIANVNWAAGGGVTRNACMSMLKGQAGL